MIFAERRVFQRTDIRSRQEKCDQSKFQSPSPMLTEGGALAPKLDTVDDPRRASTEAPLA